MERVSYNRGRMLLAGAFFALGFLFFAYAFLNPDQFLDVRRGRWIATSFGHAILVPTFAFACATMVWRACSVGFGDATAVEFTPSALRLNSIFGFQQVRWNNIAGASVENYGRQTSLRVDTRTGGLFGGKKIRVPLSGTNLPSERAFELAAIILQRAQDEASRIHDDEVASDFDPDAAIARYMTHREEGALKPAPAPAVPAMPPRPSFGRKGL